MQTPLQVTIMSLLLEGRPRVPQDRFGLFDAYYQTIYNRETAKPTSTAKLLEQHRRTVDDLHAHVGAQLQIQAEDYGNADTAMPRDAFHRLARHLLDQQEFSPGDAKTLAGQIADAATKRLVLLVPKNTDDVGFDVRSLQEFMAAHCITTGTDADVLARLRQLAPSAHWRNTWLLATGRVAALRQHLIEPVVGLLDDLDAENYLSLCLFPSASLALDLLDDRFAAPSPKIERMLLKKAVEILRQPPNLDTGRAAETLQRVATTSTATAFISEVARGCLAADPPQRITTVIAMQRWTRSTGALAALAKRYVGYLTPIVGPDHATALANHFTATAAPGGRMPHTVSRLDSWLQEADSPLAGDDFAALAKFLRELKKCTVRSYNSVTCVPLLPTIGPSVLEGALSRPAVADHLAAQLLLPDPNRWAISSALAELARRWQEHRPIGVPNALTVPT